MWFEGEVLALPTPESGSLTAPLAAGLNKSWYLEGWRLEAGGREARASFLWGQKLRRRVPVGRRTKVDLHSIIPYRYVIPCSYPLCDASLASLIHPDPLPAHGLESNHKSRERTHAQRNTSFRALLHQPHIHVTLLYFNVTYDGALQSNSSTKLPNANLSSRSLCRDGHPLSMIMLLQSLMYITSPVTLY